MVDAENESDGDDGEESVVSEPTPTPLHPLRLLAINLSDEAFLKDITDWCKKNHPTYPQASSSLLVWRVMLLSGMSIPYSPMPRGLLSILEGHRYTRQLIDMNTSPKSGDLIFWGNEKDSTRVGIVAKSGSSDEFDKRFVTVVTTGVEETLKPSRLYLKDIQNECFFLRRPG